MRTTLDIADDVLQAAKERARREKKTAGEVISELARSALNTPPPAVRGARSRKSIRGFRPFPKRGGIVTNERSTRCAKTMRTDALVARRQRPDRAARRRSRVARACGDVVCRARAPHRRVAVSFLEMPGLTRFSSADEDAQTIGTDISSTLAVSQFRVQTHNRLI